MGKKKGDNAVSVAVRVRPQSIRERTDNAGICVSIPPGQPQVVIGQKAFTYDHVFGDNTNQQFIYNSCVKGLLDGLFDGYNATVLAYGQTGSGKTYTMGTGFEASQLHQKDDEISGIIPRAARHLFEGIEQRKQAAKAGGHLEPTFEVSAQFVELYNEEIIDLLADVRTASAVRNACGIKIQEDPVRNEIYLKGATWKQVQSAEDIMNALKAGALNRTTAATNMNQQSSRSHAIFTVQLVQSRVVPSDTDKDNNNNDNGDDDLENNSQSDESSDPVLANTAQLNTTLSELEILHAKFHFVDLAGSERLKRTGATGDRAKEGISINSGLLALGNVISALGGGSGKITHVPYRDSKLTRLLQDSLGGNSRTLMIACASPSEVDSTETLNTLNYANRAKNIKNKVVANQDKSGKLITELRSRVVQLEQELQEYRQGKRVVGEDGAEMLNDQYVENVELQGENNRLRTRLKALDETVEKLQARNVQLQTLTEMAKFRAAAGTDGQQQADEENKENGADAATAGGGGSEQHLGTMIGGYLQEIETMKAKLMEVESMNEELRKQNQRYREMAGSGSLHSSPYGGAGAMSSSMLIQSARERIGHQKLALMNAAKGSPLAEGLDDVDFDENDEEVEEGGEGGEPDAEAEEEKKHSMERDRLHGDLQQLQEDINIKEQLIIELELSQRRLEQLRQDYERKLGELALRIASTEAERDQILEQMAAKKKTKQQEEEIKKVREKYEKRLADMRCEHRQLETAERENKKLQAQQSKHQSEVQRIRQEMENMKRQKVDLMNRLKEENRRIREIQAVNARKLASYKKTSRQQQNRIQRLEHESVMKAEQLKRKMEEVQRLKERQKAQQARRQTIYETKEQRKGVQVQVPTVAHNYGQSSKEIESEDTEFNTTFIVQPSQAIKFPPMTTTQQHAGNLPPPYDTSPSDQLTRQLFSQMGVGGKRGAPAAANKKKMVEEVDDEEEERLGLATAGTTSTTPSLLGMTMAMMDGDDDERKEGIEEEEEGDADEKNFKGKYLQKVHCFTAVQHTRTRPILSLHATETRMISGSKDRTAKVWDLQSGEHLMTLGNHPNNVLFAHLLADQREMALTSSMNVVKVWDLRTPVVERCVRHMRSMGFTDDGENGRCERTAEVPRGEVQIHWAAVEPQAERFLFTACTKSVRVWDLQRLEHIGHFGNVDGDVSRFVVSTSRAPQSIDPPLSPLSAVARVAVVPSRGKQVTLFDNVQIQKRIGPSTGPSIQMSEDFQLLEPPHEQAISALCLTPRALFTAGKDLSLMRFSMLDRKRDHVEPGAHKSKIQVMCPLVIEGGSTELLVTGCQGGTIKVWDIGTTNRILPAETLRPIHPKLYTMCANSQHLFTGSSENTIFYWRILDDAN